MGIFTASEGTPRTDGDVEMYRTLYRVLFNLYHNSRCSFKNTLIQFWFPSMVDISLLSTKESPYVIGYEGDSSSLPMYRRDSCNKEVTKAQQNCSYTFSNYSHFLDSVLAIEHGINASKLLPIYNCSTSNCIGVLELVSTSQSEDFLMEEYKAIKQKLQEGGYTTSSFNNWYWFDDLGMSSLHIGGDMVIVSQNCSMAVDDSRSKGKGKEVVQNPFLEWAVEDSGMQGNPFLVEAEAEQQVVQNPFLERAVEDSGMQGNPFLVEAEAEQQYPRVVARLISPRRTAIFTFILEHLFVEFRNAVAMAFRWNLTESFDIYALNDDFEELYLIDCDDMVRKFFICLYPVYFVNIRIPGVEEIPGRGTSSGVQLDSFKAIDDAIGKMAKYQTKSRRTVLSKLLRVSGTTIDRLRNNFSSCTTIPHAKKKAKKIGLGESSRSSLLPSSVLPSAVPFSSDPTWFLDQSRLDGVYQDSDGTLYHLPGSDVHQSPLWFEGTALSAGQQRNPNVAEDADQPPSNDGF